MRHFLSALLSAVLLFCFILSAFACGKNVDKDSFSTNTVTSETSSAINTEAATDNIPTVPVEDFDGFEINILMYDNMVEEFVAESETGEPINDAVFRRNQTIEETYNVRFSFSPKTQAQYAPSLRTSIISGDHSFGLLQTFLYEGASALAPEGLLYDWNNVPYVGENLDKLWWNKSSVNDLKILGKNYLITGDIGFWAIGSAMGIVFNKNLFNDYNVSFPYDIVKQGKWTLDYMISLVKDKNADLNNDGKYNPQIDQFAFISDEWDAPIAFYIGADLNSITFDDNNLPVLNFMSDRTVSAFEKAYEIIVGNGSPLVPYTADLMNHLATKAFYENRAFMSNIAIKNLRMLKNMDSEYGLIPYPKFDEAQENYISGINAGTSAYAIPSDTEDLDIIGLIVEALARESYKILTPAFFDISLQSKYARDEESVAMLELIRSTATYDMLYIYNFGGLGFSFKNLMTAKSSDITSHFETIKTRAQADIEKFVNVFQDAEQ